jgi:PAS domain S-box-containing protein
MPVVVSQFEELLSQKTAKTYTTEIKDRHDNVLTIEISSFFLVKKDNEVDNFVLIMHDITGRLETESKFAREHELLHTLMEHIPDSIYFKDEQNKFILVNNTKAAHAHTPPKEMIGKTDFDFLSEEEAKKSFEDDNHIMQTGQPVINKLEKITHGDDSERWISVTKVPRYNADGDIIGTMGISRDVTEWKQVEERLHSEQELLKALLETIPDSIYFKDNQNRFVLVNKAKADHWNVNPEDMIGKTDFDFLPEDVARQAFDDDTRIIQTGEPIIDKIEKITGSDGLIRWFSVTKIPRYDKDGNIIGTIGVSRNVTEWKRLEEMKNESLQ